MDIKCIFCDKVLTTAKDDVKAICNRCFDLLEKQETRNSVNLQEVCNLLNDKDIVPKKHTSPYAEDEEILVDELSKDKE